MNTREENKFDLNRALNKIKRHINLGYTEENYNTIAWLMGQITPMVDPNARRQLEEIWRNSYTDSFEQKDLNQLIRSMRCKED